MTIPCEIPLTTSAEIEKLLKEHLASLIQVDADQIDTKKSFLEYGISSISAIGMAGELSEKLNRDISPTIFWDYNNIDALINYLMDNYYQLSSTPSSAPITNASIKSHTIIPELEVITKLRKQVEAVAGEDLYFNQLEKFQASHKNVINFSHYNYLGFANNNDIKLAAIRAIKQYGTTCSASRVAGGELDLHKELETTLSHFLGTQDAIIFNSGHATNVTVIGNIMKTGDLIIYDSLAHNSILQGAKLSGASIIAFKHNDCHHLEQILQENHDKYNKILIVIEGLYSMDGDIPNLPDIIKLKLKYQCLLYIDEAHSLGVLGETGKGITEHWKVNPNDVDFCMGTLGKALASLGGYIAGKKAIIDYLKFSMPGFVYSIGLSPAHTAIALASLKKLSANPQLPSQLRSKSDAMISYFRSQSINCGNCTHSPVFPIILSDSKKTLLVCSALRKKGIFLQPIIYPAVEDNEARLRVFVNVTHTKKQLTYAAKEIVKEIKVITHD